MTCNECFHKNNNSCPWRGLYEDTDYAEDCIDFVTEEDNENLKSNDSDSQ